MENSNYPFLFSNDSSENCLLYCMTGKHEKIFKIGDFTYTREQNKVFYKNLKTREEYELNIPLKLCNKHKLLNNSYIFNYDETQKLTEFNDDNYGLVDVVDLKNPHIKIIDNKIFFIFNVSIIFNGNSRVQDFMVSMESSSLDLKDLYNFQIVQYTKSGTILENGGIVYVQNQKTQYLVDKLVIKQNDLENKLEIDLNYLDIQLIDRVCSIHGTNNLIFTCTLRSDGLSHSFMLYDNLSKCCEIFINQNKPIPTSTIYFDKCVHTNKEKDITNLVNNYLVFERGTIDFYTTNNIKDYKLIQPPIELQPMSVRHSDNKLKFPGYIEYKMPILVDATNNNNEVVSVNQTDATIDEVNSVNKTSEMLIPEELNPEQGTNYPGVVTMAKNFGSSMVKWAKSGFQTVDQEEVFNVRLEICKKCPQWDSQALGGGGRCKLCGCATQAKLRLATESCPINLWGPVTKS
jgi:hypothetical protein